MTERADPPGAPWAASFTPPRAHEQQFICPRIPPYSPADAPCHVCGHRVGSHAIVEGGGSCDVCAIIRAVTGMTRR